MSIIEFHYYELDKAIDERIEQKDDIRNEWGTEIFDSSGRLEPSEVFPLEPHTLLGIIQHQQEQITDLEYNSAVAWKDLQGYKDDCRGLTASDGVNSNAIEMLLERVKVLEKDNSKLPPEAFIKIYKDFNSDISSLDIRIEGLEKEVEKL